VTLSSAFSCSTALRRFGLGCAIPLDVAREVGQIEERRLASGTTVYRVVIR
jgi:hypothetical protein